MPGILTVLESERRQTEEAARLLTVSFVCWCPDRLPQDSSVSFAGGKGISGRAHLDGTVLAVVYVDRVFRLYVLDDNGPVSPVVLHRPLALVLELQNRRSGCLWGGGSSRRGGGSRRLGRGRDEPRPVGTILGFHVVCDPAETRGDAFPFCAELGKDSGHSVRLL